MKSLERWESTFFPTMNLAKSMPKGVMSRARVAKNEQINKNIRLQRNLHCGTKNCMKETSERNKLNHGSGQFKKIK